MDYTRETSSVGRDLKKPEPLIDQDLGLPDPFAVATLNGEQTTTTAVIKRTLNPYWNEQFDL